MYDIRKIYQQNYAKSLRGHHWISFTRR